MSSGYNGRVVCTEVLVNCGRVYVVRRRADYGDLIAKDVVLARLMRSKPARSLAHRPR
uniref:Uncharacterized protein n=1 Tax=Candidatus Methanogaster sp. ANME-2c ERB4 TaxID=2759911 RepID=A0A7G9YFL7_9EURY|nr:hypothetical protein DEIDBPHB_00050 [Methanosarcinales archaeon ANME-2c ERB4]